MLRTDHDELVKELRTQINDLKKELYDVKDPKLPEAFTGSTMTPERTDEFEQRRLAIKQELRSLARTRPSQVGVAMQRRIVQDKAEKTRQAFGHPASKMFAAVRAAAEK